MKRSATNLIFTLLGLKGIQGFEVKSGFIPVEHSSNNTDEIGLSKKAVPSARSRGARNGGFCQTQADCRNPALDCVPSASGGQWGTCMNLWDLYRECTSNADCMNGYACQPHPTFYRPYCKGIVKSSSGENEKNCCQDTDCPLDPTGTYSYCGTKPLDPTGVYCQKCLDSTGVYGCLGPAGVCVPSRTPPASLFGKKSGRATRELHVYDDQRMQENCVPLKDECQNAQNCPLDPTGVYQQCVKDIKTGVRFCKHPKTQCFTDRNCPQGQTCNTKYENPQGSTCQQCLDPTGVYGCLDPTGTYCVKPSEGSQGCKPCKTKPLDPTGVYDGCLDPTGVYCVPKKEQCQKCLDPTGVYGCLDPTGIYCVPPHEGSQGCKPCKTKPLDPTGVYDGCLDPTGVYCVPQRTPPASLFGERSQMDGLDMLTPANKRQLDPTGIYRVCAAYPPIDDYPAATNPRMPTGPVEPPWTYPTGPVSPPWVHRSCGQGMMDY